MSITQTETRTSVRSALEHCGWIPSNSDGTAFQLQTPQGPAELKLIHHSSEWQSWSLKSPGLKLPDQQQALSEQQDLQGPGKFVVSGGGNTICRFDLPQEVIPSAGEYDLATGTTVTPLDLWSRVVTGVACGEPPVLEAELPAEQIVLDLDARGWVTSVEAGSVRITVPLVRVFRQVMVETREPGVNFISCELGNLNGWSERSREAAKAFLHEANKRLQLVRFAHREDRLYAEVNLSVMRVPGVWLDAALEAVRTAIALTAKELAALRDPGLAELSLTEASVQYEGGDL